MKALVTVRLFLAIALISISAAAKAQVLFPWGGQNSFWDDPKVVQKLKLTDKQRDAMDAISKKANARFLQDIRKKLAPEQWRQFQALLAEQPAAAQMRQTGPDAQQVASALDVGRDVAENYLTLVNEILIQSVGAGGQYLMIGRQSTDPCKGVSDVIFRAAPGLDWTHIGLTLNLGGKPYAGNTCPGVADDHTSDRTATITATYPCALTTKGVDLALSCKLSTSLTVYVY